MSTFIARIGLELEGSWGRSPDPPFSDGTVLVEDQSLRNRPPHRITGEELYHYGEAVSPPLPLEEGLRWMHAHYPQGMDDWCGLHVHISTKFLKHYAWLASQGYWEFFLKAMEKWGKSVGLPGSHQFWGRLAGRNKYCTRAFRPLSQILRTSKGATGERNLRRTMLNFPFAMHGTVECRLFPMFGDPAIAESAIRAFVRSAEDFIGRQVAAPPIQRFKSSISMKDLGLINEAKQTILV
jgi:hypothetical protein